MPRLVVTRPGQTESYEAAAGAPEAVKTALAELEAKSDPEERATFLAEEMEKAVGGCADMYRLFGDIAGMEPQDKNPLLVSGLAPALRGCSRRWMDLDLFEVLLLEMCDAYHAPHGWLPLARDSSAKQKLKPPASACVRDLVAAMEKLPRDTLSAPIALELGK